MSDQKMRLFEIYLYKDQLEKKGFGGHVRFVSAPNERDAVHTVAFEWGHWWRTCGIREVDEAYWRETHPMLDPQKTAHTLSAKAYETYAGTKI